jgi:cytochrome c553
MNRWTTLALSLAFLAGPAAAQDNATETLGDLSQVQSIVIDRGVTKLSKSCIECHKPAQGATGREDA